jgi:uncharacterized protein with GYD domain
METYVVLCKFTKKGAKDLKGQPERTENVKKAIEEAGGKWLGSYLTMGHYDLVALTQMPSPQVAVSMLFATAAAGYVTTETLRAFSEDEYYPMMEAAGEEEDD